MVIGQPMWGWFVSFWPVQLGWPLDVPAIVAWAGSYLFGKVRGVRKVRSGKVRSSQLKSASFPAGLIRTPRWNVAQYLDEDAEVACWEDERDAAIPDLNVERVGFGGLKDFKLVIKQPSSRPALVRATFSCPCGVLPHVQASASPCPGL